MIYIPTNKWSAKCGKSNIYLRCNEGKLNFKKYIKRE
jgi:hypothetical protein